MQKQIRNISLGIVFLAMLMFIPLVNADDIGEFQLDVDDVDIYLTCNNCTTVNFTKVMGPNNQTLLSNIIATQDETYFHTLILKENLTKQGRYTYCYEAGNADTSLTGCNNFYITYTGKALALGDAVVYISLLAFLVFLFLLLLTSVGWIPDHQEDPDGKLIKISNIHFLKPMVIFFCWLVLMAILFMASNLGIAYLDDNLIGVYLFRIWQILMVLTMIALPLTVIGIIEMWARDKETQKLIERGVEFR